MRKIDEDSAGIEKEEAPIPLDEKEIVEQVVGKWEAAKSAYNPLYQKWDENWRMYHSQHEWKGKADWQSKYTLPDIYRITERAATLLSKPLTPPGSWFSIELEDQQFEDIMEGWLQFHLEGCRYRTLLKQATRNAILSALFIQKIFSGGDGKPLRIKTISPYDFWVDPSGMNRWTIEEVRVTKSDLALWSQSVTADGRPLYFNLDRIKEGRSEREQENRWRARGQLGGIEGIAKRGQLSLLEYWGPLADRHGNTVARKKVVAIANKKILVRGPNKNPFAHGQPPYRYHSFVDIPGLPVGKSLAESCVPTVLLMSEVLNLFIDASMREAMGGAEADASPGGIDPSDLKEGLVPGKIYRRMMPGPRRALEMLAGGNVPQSSLPLIELLDRGLQRVSSVTDPVSGMMVRKRGTTATEVQQAAGSALSLFDGYASEIEDAFLAPVLELSLKTLLENAGDIEDLWLEREMAKIGDDAYSKLRGMEPKQRLKLIQQQMKIKVGGISSVIAKQQSLAKLTEILALCERAPHFAMYVKPRALLAKVLDALDVDSSDILRSEEEVKTAMQNAEREREQQAAQMVQQAGGQGSAV